MRGNLRLGKIVNINDTFFSNLPPHICYNLLEFLFITQLKVFTITAIVHMVKEKIENPVCAVHPLLGQM